MCSRFLSLVLFFSLVSGAQAQLRVCADPDNLPFSNAKQQGFENKIAEVIARDLGQKLEYKWQRMGRGFVRNILNKKQCDVLLGIPAGFKPVLTTIPYYTSTYVFVNPAQSATVNSFDDGRLKQMKIGVQVVSEDYAPPAIALGRRGLVANIVGFDNTGQDAFQVMDAVASKKVGVAVVWGPTAGFYSKLHPKQVKLTPTPTRDGPGLPLTFAISMGVRKQDAELRDRLNAVLQKRRAEIERILKSYNVPLLVEAAGEARSSD
ncbi:MAG TPA: quinoprotein dehydrogenase-associated putative ABC transporter substrate-binding protein [Terriglobales bacterium]|nr:quinoprotein dehydrogenase-associated putative ABC transporter substrate-binding protein [Terriglobales bacterium]